MSFIHRPRAVIDGVRRTRTYRFFWCRNCDRTIRITSSLDPHHFLCPLCYSIVVEEFHLSRPGFLVRDHEPSSSAAQLLDSMAQRLEPTPSPQQGPITSTVDEESMPVVRVTTGILERDPSCPICKEDFVFDEKIRRMPCCHFYHSECIIPWIQIHNTCPVCRSRIITVPQSSDNESNIHHLQTANHHADHADIYDFRFEDVVNWAWPSWAELFSLWPFGFRSFSNWSFQDHDHPLTDTASSRTASSWLGYLGIL